MIELGQQERLCRAKRCAETDDQTEFVAIFGKTMRDRHLVQGRHVQARHHNQIVRGRGQRVGIGVWHVGGVAWLGFRVQYGVKFDRAIMQENGGRSRGSPPGCSWQATPISAGAFPVLLR
jgi:hypothetical protein